MTPEQKTEIEAAAWRTLVGHLQKRADVQNIDLMNLAGFCRNCMSRWMANAAAQQGVELSEPSAREMIYGMTYEEWKSRHQTEATPEQLARYKQLGPDDTTE
ncbi:MAG: DUF1244 domain-containing protein [Chromatiaceae bacterium]|nr:DUF1244 domain-containing protein [Chromatiaceae bacterium]MCP5314342.1 DUF1244 domain-containing protein [Chromatiaceae bacterium]